MGGEGQRDGIVGCSHASHEIDDCVNYIMQFISDQIAPCDPTTTFGGHQENGSFLIAAAFVTGRLRREVLWKPISMRFGERKLTLLCRKELGREPKINEIFLFYNTKRDILKLFWLDGTGSQEIIKVVP